MEIITITNEIINGRRLTKGDDLSFLLTTPLDSLSKEADKIRQHYIGERVDLCSIINGKSGKCSEDCKYCAQSAHHNTNCEVYNFLSADEILKKAKENEVAGVNRFSIVTSGRCLSNTDFEKAIDAYTDLSNKCSLKLCASHGFLSEEQFKRLKEAGVTRYHENIETSQEFFPNICTTHTFEDKINSIKLAQSVGLDVCSGGIIGMGEDWNDRISMALTLSELKISSIPINILTPIPGTPFENYKMLTTNEILRTIAIFRFINPTADIRFAAGRSLLANYGKSAFESGASAMITGNMLTTTGSTIKDDIAMLNSIGRTIIKN